MGSTVSIDKLTFYANSVRDDDQGAFKFVKKKLAEVVDAAEITKKKIQGIVTKEFLEYTPNPVKVYEDLAR